jgi:hypothetical protein
VQALRLKHVRGQRRDGTFAVRSGHAEDGCPRGEREQLDVAEHCNAAAACFTHQRDVVGKAGRQQHPAHALEPAIVERFEHDLGARTGRAQLGQTRRCRATVDHAHALAARREKARDCDAGRTEPNDQAGLRKFALHGLPSPNSRPTTATPARVE